MWGLPAATCADDESEEDAVRRAGREKLGVQVEPLQAIGSALFMTDWTARIVQGEPTVPQPGPDTQYAAMRWGEVSELVPAARQGSLCSRVLLRERGLDWDA